MRRSLLLLAALMCAGCSPRQQPAASAAPSATMQASPSAAQASAGGQAAPSVQASAGGQATAQAAASVQASAEPEQQLIDINWQWQASSYNDGSEVTASAPANYTARFLDGGTLEIRADCNGVGGSYSASGTSLDLVLGASTEVACAPGSQADVFLRDLGQVISYSIDNGALVLALDADAGSMRFALPGANTAVGAALRGESTLDQQLTARLDTLLEQSVTPKLPNPLGGASLFPASPGAILLLDTPEGRFWKAAGFARREDRTPMQPSDRFQIGSNTKLFVGVLLLQLEEDGVLSLDDQLARWLPDEAARIPNGERITLRMLADHTSGLADYADGAVAVNGATETLARLAKQYTPAELLELALQAPPVFAPGEAGRWSYSNTGYLLLGMVLEKAGGQPLGDLLAERIWQPLDMNDTSLPNGVPEPGSIADGYSSFAGPNTSNWNTSQAWAAGAMVSSAPDMLRFGQALASGAVFDDPRTLDRMADFVRTPQLAGSGWSGYGIGLAEFGDGVWGHFGRTPGFESVLMIWPERGITLVGMANASKGSVPSWQLLLETTLSR